MKFQIEQQSFVSALAKVTGAVEKRQTIPILGNVLIYAAGDRVTFTATDLDIEVETLATATVSIPGVTTVSAIMLESIVKKMSKGALITFEADNKQATIVSGGASMQLATLPEEDFPKLANTEYQSEFAMDADELKRLLDLSFFAMSTEETRYFLNGVYLLPSPDGTVRCVATDGHRLAQVDCDIEADFPGVIVPRKAVNELRKILDGAGAANVLISETKIRVCLTDTTITSKVIDGTYPDYTRVVPKDFERTAAADAGSLKAAGDLVSLVSSERTKAVKVKLSSGQIVLEVNGGLDNGRQVVDCDYQGDNFSIGCNSKYLAETLQMCNGDDAVLWFNGSGDPMKITPSDDSKVLWIVMPMRVN